MVEDHFVVSATREGGPLHGGRNPWRRGIYSVVCNVCRSFTWWVQPVEEGHSLRGVQPVKELFVVGATRGGGAFTPCVKPVEELYVVGATREGGAFTPWWLVGLGWGWSVVDISSIQAALAIHNAWLVSSRRIHPSANTESSPV